MARMSLRRSGYKAMNLKKIDAALVSYCKRLPEDDRVRLAFFRRLWDVQVDISKVVVGYEPPPAERLRELNRLGSPVFSDVPVVVDSALFVNTLEGVGSAAVESGVLPDGVCAALLRVKWNRVVAASDVFEAGRNPGVYLGGLADLLMDDGMTQDQARTAILLAALALRRQLEAASALTMTALQEAQATEPHSLNCPTCGCQAAVACVGSSGMESAHGKTLWCGQCGTVWEFERVRCARCGTQNQSNLHYFNLEGDGAHRIATCDECGGYTRTVFAEDALAPFSFEVEDVVMARLDAIACAPAIAGGAFVSEKK